MAVSRGYIPLTPRCTPLKLEVQGLARQSAWDGLALSSRPFWQASSWIWALAKMICIWGQFCALDKKAEFAERGIDFDKLAVDYVAMLNRIVDAKPADMQITTHICRGNFRSTSFSEGGYAPIAEVLFGTCRVDGFFLEYDSEREGNFAPLAHIKDQQVVLGLVTSKTGNLENKDNIIARIHEATQYVDINQLCLSPQFRFASTEEGSLLTEEAQWAKVKMIRQVAD